LGYETALGLAKKGMHVIIGKDPCLLLDTTNYHTVVSRDKSRGEDAAEKINK